VPSRVKELSGGSKRKLLVGIALLSSGSVLFFDEPSCGVDPVTRHMLWAAVARASARWALLLTTRPFGRPCD
jgi:ATP-binding cassette subfamily A (ABC1) protein 3